MSALQQNNDAPCFPDGLSWKSFTELSEAAVLETLEWRNHPEIRRWMVNQEPISLQEHKQFIAGLSDNTDKQYYLLSLGQKQIGVADFYNTNTDTASCYYGYYLNPELLGTSYGLLLEYWVAEFAFSYLSMEQIFAETKINNVSANQLHAFFGFQLVGKNQRALEEAVLTRETWMQNQEKIRPLVFRFGSS